MVEPNYFEVTEDGRIVNISLYAEMALRTANKRAKLTAEGEERSKYGIHTVLVSSHGSACPLCQQWQGRVYIDDVFGKNMVNLQVRNYTMHILII